MMRKSILSLILFCVVQCCFAQPLVTEVKDSQLRVMQADSLLNVLENGVLIIRLKSEAKKLKLLKEQEASINDQKQKDRILRRIVETTLERDKFNQVLIQAFRDHYTYSDFLVMYDTANRSLTKGVQSGIFLDQNFELDNSINLNNRNYLILRHGYSDAATTNRRLGLIFTDEKLVDLRRPFPHFHSIHHSLLSFFGALIPKFRTQKNIESIVIDINNTLFRFN